ncbi:MAG: ABC transporter permease [Deltaproteobacteria bacterium]|nr:ABC transporter permease [Deltaproteobacteria bacterium]
MIGSSAARARLYRQALPYLGILGLLIAWQLGILISQQTLLPGPLTVAASLVHLAVDGHLFSHIVASLFRVTWGYVLAAVVAIPLGLLLGWSVRSGRAAGPILQFLRPISPIAWTPLAILFFGIGDLSTVFIIFIAVLWPLAMSSIEAAMTVNIKFVRAGRNFGLSTRALLFKIILSAALPQLILGMRLSLGIAWLVMVAGEMIASHSGLGFLIIDARNAGNRYDEVIAGMIVIGVLGVLLDTLMRRLQASRALAWNYNRLTSDPTTEGPLERRRARR